MTPEQKRTLDFVRSYYAEHGRGPTQRTIGAALGMKNIGGINARLQWLAQNGYLRRTTERHANYIPVEQAGIDLTGVSTAALMAELHRRMPPASSGSAQP